MNIELKKNGNNGVFELISEQNIAVGELTFVIKDNSQMIINHTGVNPDLRGRGYAEKLVLKAIEFARLNHLKILPYCSYVSVYISKHPEVQDIV
ncbi:GNAT family N-acetyltransferase [Faecalibacter rhinopitheci]|uniref:N-acetyltransferase n=1 Tax=Faecalibacter rhinopitheci TaxID=2779678 RepID=A0A8J7KE83_9FLAO|nr:GNAT family N-acetyltransferase [Faecalibacter rhinopitheci]MBF0598156.1 N-acetyltransferase [Faecalibacter rhinopitheci]MBQ0148346.1 N-acetyltransferase [Candidatus Onthonaster equi]